MKKQNNIKFPENINKIITKLSHRYMQVSSAFYHIADFVGRGCIKILNKNEFEIKKINELTDNFITLDTKVKTKLNFEELVVYLSNKIFLEEFNIQYKIFSIDNKKSEKEKEKIVRSNISSSVRQILKVISFYRDFIKNNKIMSEEVITYYDNMWNLKIGNLNTLQEMCIVKK